MQNSSTGSSVVTGRPFRASDWVAHHAAMQPEKLALIEMPSQRRFTYAEMDKRANRAASMLRAMGIGRGDRVAFLCLNTTDILEWQFAIWRLGAIAVALNFRLTAAELAVIIEDSGPRVVLVDRTLAVVAEELAKTTDVERWIETCGDGSDSAYEQGLSEQDISAVPPPAERHLSDIAMLMYSSGTTGKPKGVIITHEMLLFSAFSGAMASGLTHRSVGLAAMPLFHIGAFNIFTSPLLCFGGTALILRAFDPSTVLDLFDDAELGISHFLGAPAVYNALLAHPSCKTVDFSRLTAPFVGAESVPEALIKACHARGIKLREGYGLTETTAATTIMPEADMYERVGSAGKPFMHSEVRIADPEGNPVPPGTTGEILTRGPMVTPGYWNREDANRDSFVDGWFRTGDVGIVDEDGFLYVTDRVKDMYISGGENVYPAEVEGVIYAMEEVSEVAVIGVPDNKWGEVGHAFIVLKSGANLSIESIHTHCEGRLSRYKWPVHFECVDSLPRTPSGKVQKFLLRKAPAT